MCFGIRQFKSEGGLCVNLPLPNSWPSRERAYPPLYSSSRPRALLPTNRQEIRWRKSLIGKHEPRTPGKELNPGKGDVETSQLEKYKIQTFGIWTKRRRSLRRWRRREVWCLSGPCCSQRRELRAGKVGTFPGLRRQLPTQHSHFLGDVVTEVRRSYLGKNTRGSYWSGSTFLR